jgi:arylsulfatase A-like enzyme
MSRLARALALGAGFGLAAAVLDLWASLLPFTDRRMGPGPGALTETGLWMVALGALLGLAGWPILALLRRRAWGAIVHVAWLAGAWFALERWVELDSPLFAAALYVRSFGAAAIVLLALALGRLPRWPRLAPWLVGVLLFAGGVYAPSTYLAWTTPSGPERHPAAAAPPGAPDVVLVVLDTVRAENVSSYGHERDTAPTLDALAAEGSLFLDATSPSTWSLPSHASLFTGRYPSSHGAFAFRTMLDDRYPTLAEVLAARGFDTFCFTANPWISDGLGLTRGFASQDLSWQSDSGGGFSFIGRLRDRLGRGGEDKGGGTVASHFEAWARERPANAPPAFVFLNFVEAHFPYHQIPPEFRSRYTDLPLSKLRRISMELMALQFGGPRQDVQEVGPPARALYDGGVRYSDWLLHRVVEALRARGSLDGTLLVVLADHGELLGEHGGFFGHGPTLYQRMVRVPFLMRAPGRIPSGRRVETPVSTLGVFATILDLLGIEAPPTLQVPSLLPLATGEGPAPQTPILSESLDAGEPLGSGNDPQMKGGVHLRALREGRFKLVESSAGDLLLYDLASDPAEEHDLATAQPAETAALRQRLEAARVRLGLPPLDRVDAKSGPPALDAATREQLRQLGYAE